MPFTAFKNKASNVIFVITSIGALITLINYIKPVVNYFSILNDIVLSHEGFKKEIETFNTHLKEYENDRENKKSTFSIGLRSDIQTHQIIYVDEGNGIYRAFLDDRTGRYYYYNVDGDPIYCYTQEKVDRFSQDELRIEASAPLHYPEPVDSSILVIDTIQ